MQTSTGGGGLHGPGPVQPVGAVQPMLVADGECTSTVIFLSMFHRVHCSRVVSCISGRRHSGHPRHTRDTTAWNARVSTRSKLNRIEERDRK